MIRWLIIVLLLPLAVLAQDELNSEAGLVGRWLVPGYQTGNGAVPTLALDVSGLKNSARSSNSPSWSVTSAMQSMSYSSNTSQRSVISGLKYFSNFTVMVWVRITTTNTQLNYSIFEKSSGLNGQYNWILASIRSNHPTYPNMAYFQVGDGTGNSNSSFVGGIKIRDSVWHHVVGVRGNGLLTLYVDGISRATTNDILGSANYGVNAEISHGSWFTDYASQSVSDVRYYNRALTATEIKSIYEQGLAPK